MARQVIGPDGLTEKQRAFADFFIETKKGAESARKAGYSPRGANRAAEKCLRKVDIKRYIARRMALSVNPQDEEHKQRIAAGDEANAFLTAVMRGEVRDAFDLDPALSDRLAAAKALRRIYAVADDLPETAADIYAAIDKFLAEGLQY